ncbi:hypothetical protein [Streptomyces sp. NPDC047966]|uniref:hypothetical protein n=1 Tax=Streptomyces sp. NPDC047966 TaxID=3155745 RepID=UPI003447359A
MSRVTCVAPEWRAPWNWRFNLRSSNTEPVVRLNVESRADVALMQAKTNEILALLGAQI